MKHIAMLLMLLAIAGCGKKAEPPKADVPKTTAPDKQNAEVEAAAKAAALKAVGLSEEDLRANAPERERIERDHAELYGKLAAQAGGDLSRCVVTAREADAIAIPGAADKGKMMTLTANCPDNVPQYVMGR